MLTSRLHEDQPDICDRCLRPVHRAAADPDPDAARWYHNEVADDVFCGLVMHAADRTAANAGPYDDPERDTLR